MSQSRDAVLTQLVCVAQIAVVRLDEGALDVWIQENVVHPCCIENGRKAFDPMNGVAFVQQDFGQIAAVLSGNAGCQSGPVGLCCQV